MEETYIRQCDDLGFYEHMVYRYPAVDGKMEERTLLQHDRAGRVEYSDFQGLTVPVEIVHEMRVVQGRALGNGVDGRPR